MKSVRNLFRVALLVIVSMIVLAVHGGLMTRAAETAAIGAKDPYADVTQGLDAIAAKLTDLAKRVDAAGQDDAALADLKLKVEAAGKASLALGVGLQGRYGEVTKRLTELGEPPAAGQPAEPELVTSDRVRLNAEKAQINALTARAEGLNKQAGDLVNKITDIRRDMFTQTLFGKTEFTEQMGNEMRGAVSAEAQDFVRAITSWAKFVWNFKRTQLLAALGLSFFSALLFVSGAYRVFQPLIHRRSQVEEPAYITRLSVAFWSTTIPSLSIATFAAMTLFFLDYFNVLRPDIEPILSALMFVLVAVYFVWRLARSVLAPGKPQWRLVNVSDRGARVLLVFALIMAIINGADYFLEETTKSLDSPVVVTIAKSLWASLLMGLTLIALSFVKVVPGRDGNNADRRWPPAVRYLLVAAGIGLILLSLGGYIGLARFAANQFVIVTAILITMYIGILSGRAIALPGAFANTVGGQYLARRFGLSAIRVDQLGLASGLGIYLLVIVLGLPLLLLQWGFRINDIRAMAVSLLTEITIGNISISVVSIFGGVLIFGVGLFLSRWFQRWLDGNVMERSQVDPGVRNSVNMALGYAGVALAAVLGISSAGIDLSSLALVAGALSLGIGFGLQTIVSNFVSGLILLAERPFKVGDWVVTGKTEGIVKRISVRATEIETFQNQSIIVPNSELINASLGNWTHRNTIGRSEIPVGVSYDSDPRKVMDILLDLARAHPLVLGTPEPQVAFLGFGDFSLNFELRFHLADLMMGTVVRNDLRLAIVERFRQEGIEIPFPQRNLNIRFSDDNASLGVALEEEGVPAAMAEKIRSAGERKLKAAARPSDKAAAKVPPKAEDEDDLG